MQRSFIRPAALACTTAALAFISPGAFAQGASITLNDPNCVSFTLGGTAPNQTLTCVQSTTPLCTISGPAGGTIGTPITVNTTICVPAAATYLWSGGGCAGQTTKNCTDPGAGYTNGQQVSYTVTATNGAGTGPASNVQKVTWTTTPPAQPSGCSVVQTPPGQLAVGGGNVTLTASCTGGNPVTWSWQGGFAQAQTTAAVGPGSVTSTTQFTATATNGGGSTPTNYTVQVSTGGGGGISCSGFSQTTVLTENWANPVRMFTSNAGGFPSDGAVVVVFTTSSLSSPNKNGGIIGAEYGSPTATRIATLSTQPCDFVGPFGSIGTVTSGTIVLNFLAPGSTPGGLPVLQPSTTYYINIMNAPNGGCTGSNCNMFFDFGKPRGT